MTSTFPALDSRSDRIDGTSYKSQHLHSLDGGKMISITLKSAWYTRKFQDSQGYVVKPRRGGKRGGGRKGRETEQTDRQRSNAR